MELLSKLITKGGISMKKVLGSNVKFNNEMFVVVAGDTERSMLIKHGGKKVIEAADELLQLTDENVIGGRIVTIDASDNIYFVVGYDSEVKKYTVQKFGCVNGERVTTGAVFVSEVKDQEVDKQFKDYVSTLTEYISIVKDCAGRDYDVAAVVQEIKIAWLQNDCSEPFLHMLIRDLDLDFGYGREALDKEGSPIQFIRDSAKCIAEA